MKLAEALLIRGNLQNRLKELRNRLCNNAVVAEGEKPAENPDELLKEVNDTLNEFTSLVTRINLTNSLTFKDGKTLTEILAERDSIKEYLSIERSFLYEASSTGTRSRNSEIKIVSTVNVRELQKQIDLKSKELRNLEISIQELNWVTELKD